VGAPVETAPPNSLLDLGAPLFTMDMKSNSFLVWIGLGGENSEPFLSSEQKQRALRRAGRLVRI